MLEISAGDTAWVLTSAALVLLMTPGLAFFYGGMVRAKGVLNMMMMSFISMGTIGVLWVLFGYSMAFGNSWGFEAAATRDDGPTFIGLLGNPLDFAGLSTLMSPDAAAGTLPALAFVAFQACFAIIAVALVSGAIADRASFGGWTLFTILWGVLVYFPVAGWVFAFDGFTGEHGGWIANWLGALDFAGGTAIHINAGISALALALVLGPRTGLGNVSMAPHSLTFTMIGASLLWFGWFGFNAGSALEASGGAALAMVNTWVATACAALSWMFAEWLLKGKPSMLGAASGAVAGLVAITPAAGFVGVMGAIIIGLLAGVVCLWGVNGLKKLLGADDSLDVFGVHGVGGILGAVLTGVFCDPALGGTGVYDYVANAVAPYDMTAQVISQLWGVGTVIVWSGVVSLVAYKLVDIVIGLRVPEEEEREGLDLTSHGESAYHH